jgi:HopA1 effector protein family
MHPTVTEFLEEVWSCRTLNRAMPLDDIEDAIYDLYTPPPPVGTAQTWTQVDFHPMNLNQMSWRVYISATSVSLMYVWQMLQPLFQAQAGVAAAKHTTPQAAASRIDTIVVYLRDAMAKEALIAAMRLLFQGRPGVGGAPAVPPKLQAMHFKNQIPPTTRQVHGLQGVSDAQQPIRDGWAEDEEPIPAELSFGGQLSKMLAAAYRTATSKEAFAKGVEANFLQRGMDINRPWQQILMQANRDQLVAAGNAARLKRGYQ